MAHHPRKRFGQHFLEDRQIIERIIQAVTPKPEQALVEIGPGHGAITLPLLHRCKQLTVVELDRDLLTPLRQRCESIGKLTIFQGDALKVNFCSLMDDGRSIRVVGNLPYNISTPLLFHLMEQAHCVDDMHFMLQQEVVNRMAAIPGNKVYGRLSVMIQYYCQVVPLFSIPPQAFNPPPKVTSSFVRLIPYNDPPVTLLNRTTFEQLVKQAFSQRRKTIRNSLKEMLTELQIKACEIDPSIRPEQLSLQQFAALANNVDQQNQTDIVEN